MSKGLEALERICQFKNPRDFYLKTDTGECKEWHFETIRELFPDEFDIITKTLEAFDIIKAKKVDVYSICMHDDYDEYVRLESILINKSRLVTQEEFYFLKEIMQ